MERVDTLNRMSFPIKAIFDIAVAFNLYSRITFSNRCLRHLMHDLACIKCH